MSSRRQRSIPLGGRYRQVSLHILCAVWCWWGCTPSHSIGLVFGCALFWYWIPLFLLFVFFANITINVLFHRAGYDYYWDVILSCFVKWFTKVLNVLFCLKIQWRHFRGFYGGHIWIQIKWPLSVLLSAQLNRPYLKNGIAHQDHFSGLNDTMLFLCLILGGGHIGFYVMWPLSIFLSVLMRSYSKTWKWTPRSTFWSQ